MRYEKTRELTSGDKNGKGNMMIQKNNNLWILVATILGVSMAFLDGSVVGIALPRLQRDLSVSAASVQWVVEAYSLKPTYRRLGLPNF